MLTEGFPSGVSIFFVTGNERGEAFAKTLAKALNEEDIAASAIGGRDERTMESRLKQTSGTRNDQQFEPVTVVVGDKP